MRLARAESCWRRFWNFGSDHCLFLIWFLSDPKPKLVLSMLRPNRSGFIHSVNLTSYEWRSKQRKREGEIKEREKMGQNFKVEIATRKRQKNITLTFLNVAIGMLHPSLRNADIGIQFFNATMQIDATRSIFHLVTSVIWKNTIFISCLKNLLGITRYTLSDFPQNMAIFAPLFAT